MITCRELIEFLDRYVANELTPEQRRSFDWHLRLCRDCRNYLTSYTQTIKLGKLAYAGGDDPAPNDVPEDLIAAILAARKD
jgi:predicted anti-sigma-YlaC factor YlaD